MLTNTLPTVPFFFASERDAFALSWLSLSRYSRVSALPCSSSRVYPRILSALLFAPLTYPNASTVTTASPAYSTSSSMVFCMLLMRFSMLPLDRTHENPPNAFLTNVAFTSTNTSLPAFIVICLTSASLADPRPPMRSRSPPYSRSESFPPITISLRILSILCTLSVAHMTLVSLSMSRNASLVL